MGKHALAFVALCLLPALLRGADPPARPRSADEVRKKLAEIIAAPAKPPEGMAGERAAALRRLKAYRYLAGVPYDVALDDDYNAACEAGTKLLAKIGRADHKPKNPGLPEDEYQLAYKGTSHSNLASGLRSLEAAVDEWLWDSDGANIDRLGHRRWCLNPAMQKTGFGRTGTFSAMWSFDAGRKPPADYDFVAWPPPGPVPAEFFRATSAWSVSLNPRKYNAPGKDVAATVHAADDKGDKTGEALKLNYSAVDLQGFGVPNCVIFRPEKFKPEPGRRYVVEVEGVTRGREKKPAAVKYVVEFMSVK